MIVFKAIFIRYLLMPLIALLLVGIMYFINKKEAVFKNKTLIVYTLIAVLLLGLPGLGGFAGNMFCPYWYLMAQILYLAAGILHVQLLGIYFRKENRTGYTIFFEITLTLLCIVGGAYLFTLLFNWISVYPGYAWNGATSIFIFPAPLFFYYAYLRLTDIPFEIYKVWQYDAYIQAASFDGIDFDKLMVLNLEFAKNPREGNRFTVKAKAPPEIKLGEWFNRFIEDYNTKYPLSPIITTNEEGEPHSWIFYVKRSFFHPRRYLDFEKNITENRITEHVSVICKRVIQYEEEKNGRNIVMGSNSREDIEPIRQIS
ncbi:TssN family type VI secretion system protein [Chitinophagaceae bacterium MMS25-I14]